MAVDPLEPKAKVIDRRGDVQHTKAFDSLPMSSKA
jgi:hypothetical protein